MKTLIISSLREHGAEDEQGKEHLLCLRETNRELSERVERLEERLGDTEEENQCLRERLDELGEKNGALLVSKEDMVDGLVESSHALKRARERVITLIQLYG